MPHIYSFRVFAPLEVVYQSLHEEVVEDSGAELFPECTDAQSSPELCRLHRWRSITCAYSIVVHRKSGIPLHVRFRSIPDA